MTTAKSLTSPPGSSSPPPPSPSNGSAVPVPAPLRRRRRRRATRPPNPNLIPPYLAANPLLASSIAAVFPPAYDFEIHKTLHRILRSRCRRLALQLPEGLSMFACPLADLFARFASPSGAALLDAPEGAPGGVLESVTVLGDVTYGACCVDDLGAAGLGCDLVVHYGHSCLVPTDAMAEVEVEEDEERANSDGAKCQDKEDCSCSPKKIQVLYVFVEIRVDLEHAAASTALTLLPSDSNSDPDPESSRQEGGTLYVMGTVQFRTGIAQLAATLRERLNPKREDGDNNNTPRWNVVIPQAKPLSPGEVLGCTAPKLQAEGGGQQAMVFLADGRFHLEAAMITNPHLRALRYDPYSKVLSEEKYETEKMKRLRHRAILRARSAQTFGLILGTLGRQGNPAILGRIRSLLRRRHKSHFVVLLSEIFPDRLAAMSDAEAWVQVACPRLSVDWGHHFHVPVLSPFELEVCLGNVPWVEEGDGVYPMDFYRNGSGEWTNYHENNKNRRMRSHDVVP